MGGGEKKLMKEWKAAGGCFGVMTDGLHSVSQSLSVINGVEVEILGRAFMKHTHRRFEMSAPILLWLSRCLHKAVC